MSAIGGQVCTFVRGHLADGRQRVRVWEVPGLNGYGAKRMGLGDSDWSVLAEIKSTSAVCNAFIANIEAMQGSIVTIVNDWGDTFLNCLITKVGRPEKAAEIRYGGARVRIRIEGVRK